MKNFYFDICAIPLFLLIIYTYYRRGLEHYREYRMFFIATVVSLACALLDIAMEFVVNPTPLAPGAVVLGSAISFSYKLLRNSCLVVYLLFVISYTKTNHQIAGPWRKALVWLPYAVLCGLLLQNCVTGNVFSVTAEGGYERGPLLIVLYAIAGIYDVVGIAYCLACRKLLEREKWVALISVYVLSTFAVCFQMVYADLMLELFSTALGLLMVALLVLRPEDTVDAAVGVQNWKSFQMDLHNVLISGRRVGIVVLDLPYANEGRNHVGDERYAAYVARMMRAVLRVKQPKNLVRFYYEEPEYLYLMLWDPDESTEAYAKECIEVIRTQVKGSGYGWYWAEPRVCLVRVPDDLGDEATILHLCHHFSSLSSGDGFCRASEIVESRNFAAWSQVDTVLDRAVNAGALQMYYQPIYDLETGRFHSAEALARIIDPELGMVSPIVFIPAAERSGMILPLGTTIIEQVFRFISEHDLDALGITFIEINLSTEQCLQADLPDIVESLQERYGVSPSQVNFEITESSMGADNPVMGENLDRLHRMGYHFSLDDFGVGYSNIWRLRKLPLSLIKVDKSLVDDLNTEDGRVIMESTVAMVHGIGKETVVEGVERHETLEVLEDLSCDFIQGYYFSQPLPADDFVAFLLEHQGA